MAPSISKPEEANAPAPPWDPDLLARLGRTPVTSTEFKDWFAQATGVPRAPPRPKRVEASASEFSAWLAKRGAAAPATGPAPTPSPAPANPPELPPFGERTPTTSRPPPLPPSAPVSEPPPWTLDEVNADSVGPSPGTRFRQWLGAAGAAFLGGVLLVAAWTKMIDPESFVEMVRAEHLDFLFPGRVVAFLALAAEVGVGTSLLMGLRRKEVLVPAVLLTAFFLFLTGRTYVLWLQGSLDEGHNCGCFGHLVERSPAEAFWQDAALLVPALVLSFFGRVPAVTFPFRRAVTAGAMTVVAVLFAGFAPDLPLDDLATKLKVGSQLSEICIGKDKPPEAGDADKKKSGRTCLAEAIPLAVEKTHLVVIADLEDPDLVARIPELNEFAGRGALGEAPTLWLLTTKGAEEIARFNMLHGASLGSNRIVQVPSNLLRPLYRRLPRSFRVVDGRVVETYDGLPPLGSLVSAPPG